jgi:hypothetical protein
MTFFIVAITLIFQNYSVDLQKIEGATQDGVALILGQPSKIERQPSCKCDKVYYLNNNLYIIYFQDKPHVIWCKTSKVTILNFDKVRVLMFTKDRKQNEVRMHLIYHQEQKCCDDITL